jgi:hypothetical protein
MLDGRTDIIFLVCVHFMVLVQEDIMRQSPMATCHVMFLRNRPGMYGVRIWVERSTKVP